MLSQVHAGLDQRAELGYFETALFRADQACTRIAPGTGPERVRNSTPCIVVSDLCGRSRTAFWKNAREEQLKESLKGWEGVGRNTRGPSWLGFDDECPLALSCSRVILRTPEPDLHHQRQVAVGSQLARTPQPGIHASIRGNDPCARVDLEEPHCCSQARTHLSFMFGCKKILLPTQRRATKTLWSPTKRDAGVHRDR